MDTEKIETIYNAYILLIITLQHSYMMWHLKIKDFLIIY